MAAQRPRSVHKIGAVTTDWSATVKDQTGRNCMGGAGWARLGQLSRPSTNRWVLGIKGIIGNKIAVRSTDNQVHADCSLIVMQRYMDKDMDKTIEVGRANGQIIVNDLDDWFWGLHKDNAASNQVDPILSPESNINHYRKSLLASNLIVASTQFLADRIEDWADIRVEVIPNGVDVSKYSIREHRDRPPIIGWAGSTAHRSGDLEILIAPFNQFPKSRFHHTGHFSQHPSFAEKTKIKESQLTVFPMFAPHEYPHSLAFDIGVIPLADIAFNEAKSNIKGLEYAAAGIPFIASPLPEYVSLSEEHGIGRLAKTTKDWVREIKALQDFDTRKEEALRQRKAVTAFDVKFQARAWDELIWSLV